MTNEIKMENTLKCLSGICDCLDSHSLKYDVNTDKMLIDFSITGDDLPVKYLIRLLNDNQLIKIYSFLPFSVKDNKLTEMCVALAALNYKLSDGVFTLDMEQRVITYAITSSYLDSVLSNSAIDYLLFFLYGVVENYNDKLYDLNESNVDLTQFVSEL